MRNIYAVLLALLMATLTGCASVPMASIDQDSTAKSFTTAPNKASLYIYRNENFGAAIPVTVSVNGKTLGQTAAMTYFHLNLVPGKYTVSSHAEDVSELELNVSPGKNYFIWQEIKMGMWSARSKLQEVDEQRGRAGVIESKLVASKMLVDDFSHPSTTDTIARTSTESTPSTTEKLRELKELKKEGIISSDEYEKKKEQLLNAL